MGNRILNATKRPLGITVDVQSDYSHIKLTELRECFNIWTTVINEKERLDQNIGYINFQESYFNL